jgi:uncharacterized Ntn-hydrolase superfamily protein
MGFHRFCCFTLVVITLLWFHTAYGTFSIVAVDTITGEIGSAGASCISGSRILSDIVVGLGGIHTQAYYYAANQQYARSLMLLGVPPEAMMDSLVAHDAQGTPGYRQYGVVYLAHGRSAAYTGANCQDWKGHRTGPGYAAQGNILSGPEIVDAMEVAFLNTPGLLCDRLMAALQAAKRPGADTRCWAAGKSAISSFIRVARPGDIDSARYLNLNVLSTPGSTDPIDVLQQLFDQWHDSTAGSPDVFLTTVTPACDTLIANGTDSTRVVIIPRNNQNRPSGAGAELLVWVNGAQGSITDPVFSGDSVYTCLLTAPAVPGVDTISVYSAAGLFPGELVAHPVVHYVTASGVVNPPSPAALPHVIAFQIFPNPFNSVVRISLELAVAAHTELAVFNLLGQRVATLHEASQMTAGVHIFRWDASSFTSGMYIVRLHANDHTLLRKVLLIR